MAKRPTQKTITSGFSSAGMLNYNVTEMLSAFDNTLSLDGSTPNAMGADFDMNSNDILNAGDITAVNVTVTGTLTGDFDAATILNGTVAPTTEGSDGDFYIDTVTTTLYGPKATTWPAGVTLVGSGLAAVVNDATPQLGGTLDANGNTIDMGTYVLTDAKVGKLDGIEALADVTDAANVVSSLDTAVLTDAGTPSATDQVLIKDAATGVLQTADFSDFGGGGATNLGYTPAPTNGVVTSDTGSNATLTVADATNAGIMVPEYFTRLAAVEAAADVTDAANVVAALDGATLDTATVAATDLVLTKDVGTGNLQTVTAQAIADLGSGGANLAYTAAPTNGTVTSDSGTDATLTVADATNAGLMVPEYFTRLASVEAAADVTDTTNVTAAGALMDSEVDADIKTLVLPANTTISAFGASLIDDANAAAAQTTLGVDPAGTDNSTDLTLAGTPDYITLSGQVLTRNAVDLAADVTGNLPVTNLNSGTGASATTYWRGDGTWVTPAGSGDVSKVGTPVNNQIGVWTGDGTLEGDADFTFDAATNTLAIAASGKVAFGAITILDDTTGTTTLSNIDALDATTEATIETAIDTLSNLTSVGTIATGVWEATDVAVLHGGTGSSTAAGAATNLGVGTGDSPQFTAVNVGHATDTTLARVSAGLASIEGDTIALLTATQTMSSKTLADVLLTGAIGEEVFTLPSSTTPELDPADGTVQKWTLTGASTPTEVFADGESITLMIDDGTAYAITWPTMTWVNNAGVAPTLATTGFTTVTLWHFGTLYGALVGDGT